LESRYLQIDHRVPYLVAGDGSSATLDVAHYMLVCGSCNRAKSWSCERCPNGIGSKQAAVCKTCYWATPVAYEHVATMDIRRLDLTWTGDEVVDFDAARVAARQDRVAVPQFVKDAVRRLVRKPARKA